MRDKRRPWLDFDGSLELARQEKVARDEISTGEAKERVRSRRSKKLAVFLMLFYGGFGLHRYYLYDTQILGKIVKFHLLIYAIFGFLVLIFGFDSRVTNILFVLIILYIAIKEYIYVSKTVDQINKDISS